MAKWTKNTFIKTTKNNCISHVSMIMLDLIKFSEGKIDITFNENLSKNFVRNLSERLLTWTKKRWVITLTKGLGQKTLLEKQSINKKELLENEKKSEVYKKFKNIFPDGDLIGVNKKEE